MAEPTGISRVMTNRRSEPRIMIAHGIIQQAIYQVNLDVFM